MKEYYKNAPVLEVDDQEAAVAAIVVYVQLEGIFNNIGPKELLWKKFKIVLPADLEDSWQACDFFQICRVKLISLDSNIEKNDIPNLVRVLEGVSYDS